VEAEVVWPELVDAARVGRWKRERGEKGREGKYSMTCGPHQLAVGIEDGLRVWMDAGELDLEERISVTRMYRG
jgi:hypothetical protein